MKIRILLALVAVFTIIWLGYAVTDRVLVSEKFSNDFGRIDVRYVKKHRFSLSSLFGYGDGFYRCEYFHSIREPVKSCISIDESSFRPSSIAVSWDDARQATVYFNGKPLFKCVDAVWNRIP